ncbi:MAG: polysaccharide pyruvyl transferase family protein, partial [Lachnospiraceae bacterium]|nr:polysaccharide pyruvyl transferase family protein [Lachnospiraceae bacterium]
FRDNSEIREHAFEMYSEKAFTNLSPIFVGYKELCAGAGSYSAVIVGSDQLWSPAGLPTNYFNLMFVPDCIRKISVASSFGVNQIPWYQTSRTKEYLKRIDFLSVRENRGAEIVKELTGRNVPVVADPVFLLSEDDWERLIPKKNIYNEPYVFAYFLGNNEEYRVVVKKFAAENGLKIVTFRHVDQFNDFEESFGDYAPYDADPGDFLNILRGAKFVFTDSLHGTIFSVIHKKNFVIFDRYSDSSKVSKNSRIDSLCDNLDIKSKRYKGDLEKNLYSELDYEVINKNISVIVENIKNFLDTALSGIK